MLGLAFAAGLAACPAPSRQPLLHSHNDYTREHPLLDALDKGFDSVEADVFLIDGKLRVAHQRGETRADRTLESLYLDPLLARAHEGGGWIRPDGQSLVLLIDCKAEAGPCYEALSAVLPKYADILTSHGPAGKVRAVTVIVSGNEARASVKQDAARLVALDGDAEDLDSDAPADLVPWVSLHWEDFLWKWGPFQGLDHERAADAACRARKKGRLLRVYGGPDNEEAWRAACAAGVDILNTDHLTRSRDFLPLCRAVRP